MQPNKIDTCFKMLILIVCINKYSKHSVFTKKKHPEQTKVIITKLLEQFMNVKRLLPVLGNSSRSWILVPQNECKNKANQKRKEISIGKQQ